MKWCIHEYVYKEKVRNIPEQSLAKVSNASLVLSASEPVMASYDSFKVTYWWDHEDIWHGITDYTFLYWHLFINGWDEMTPKFTCSWVMRPLDSRATGPALVMAAGSVLVNADICIREKLGVKTMNTCVVFRRMTEEKLAATKQDKSERKKA